MQPVGGGGGLIGQHDPRTRPHPSPARRRLPRLLSTAVAGLPAGRPQLQSRWLWEGCGGTLQPGPFSLKLFSVAIYSTPISH